jgi:hypothetical protein
MSRPSVVGFQFARVSGPFLGTDDGGVPIDIEVLFRRLSSRMGDIARAAAGEDVTGEADGGLSSLGTGGLFRRGIRG